MSDAQDVEETSRSAEESAFLKGFMKAAVEGKTDSLTPSEKRLAERYAQSQQRFADLTQQLHKLQMGVEDTRKRLQQEIGKASGILESVLTLHELK